MVGSSHGCSVFLIATEKVAGGTARRPQDSAENGGVSVSSAVFSGWSESPVSLHVPPSVI